MHGTFLKNLQVTLANHYNLPLVKQFYKKNGMRAQAPKGEKIFTTTLNNKLVAALRLSPVNQYHLLRSMCVSEKLRHMGIGSALLQAIQPELNQLNCYCFPYSHLQAFYTTADFVICDALSAPPEITDKFYRYLNNGKDICLMKHQPQS